jgi:hypothetical protein
MRPFIGIVKQIISGIVCSAKMMCNHDIYVTLCKNNMANVATSILKLTIILYTTCTILWDSCQRGCLLFLRRMPISLCWLAARIYIACKLSYVRRDWRLVRALVGCGWRGTGAPRTDSLREFTSHANFLTSGGIGGWFGRVLVMAGAAREPYGPKLYMCV